MKASAFLKSSVNGQFSIAISLACSNGEIATRFIKNRPICMKYVVFNFTPNKAYLWAMIIQMDIAIIGNTITAFSLASQRSKYEAFGI